MYCTSKCQTHNWLLIYIFCIRCLGSFIYINGESLERKTQVNEYKATRVLGSMLYVEALTWVNNAAFWILLYFGWASFWYVLGIWFYQRVNLAKLGTGSLWRYQRSFHLVGVIFPMLLSQIAMLIIQFCSFFPFRFISNLQANISPNPTKEQLVNAIQKHFSSQVSAPNHSLLSIRELYK